ncbi:MAG: hypothetical protein HYV03_03330 [Deltaproteobacteria bacterium]|nr:hypothetical protein [Deltaproteobacteria bacterium]
MFFQHLYSPGSRRAFQAASETVAEFARWGFLASARPVIAQAGKRTVGSYPAWARRNILRRLLVERREITLAIYLAALHGSLSRQQAYLDLQQFPELRRTGHGRGATWCLKA